MHVSSLFNTFIFLKFVSNILKIEMKFSYILNLLDDTPKSFVLGKEDGIGI